MSQRLHRPLPDDVVRSLVSAGLSSSTVQAMEGWKAREVLELLRDHAPAAGSQVASGRTSTH